MIEKQKQQTSHTTSIIIPEDEYLMSEIEVDMLKNEFKTLKVLVSAAIER